ncbi:MULTISPECIES: hypothetical protein [Stappiaceae]|jgi:hypothetical protein|uniref:hypothetical protein n=1 Tax=Stappiaceae TaxID=2821832 RepID=UPI001ADBA104|nr:MULTISPECIES: hypothetical protein [Stappiaceae]MBO9457941.1 hypothetical protein [Labrenzia sp. R5_0]UES40953.1 hypothetical protein GFC08_25725 [Roseibium aggregatum]
MARTIRNLGELIGLLNRGRFVEKCNEELERVMMALEDLPEQKGKAKITLEITIARQQELVNITPVVKAKLPESGTFSATPFWESDGALSVEHPNQRDMFAGPRKADPAATHDREERERADLNG